jgi:hypothetical protein
VVRLLVEPPAVTPLPYGLLSVAQPANPGTPHWQNGVIYETHCGMGGITYDPCLVVFSGTGGPTAPSDPEPKANTDTSLHRGATAFTTFAAFDCSPVGEDEHTQIAERELLRSEGWQVEQAFWTGNPITIEGGEKPVVHPHLADDTAFDETTTGGTVIRLQTAATDVTPTPGTAIDAAQALGLLEDALADCYGGVGVIHIPRIALPTFAARGLVRREGSQLFTTGGNLVAAGSGYTGSGPDGAMPSGGPYIYATGAVSITRGPVTHRPPRGSDEAARFDKATNTVHSIAERTNLLLWECCHVAVQVALGVPVT